MKLRLIVIAILLGGLWPAAGSQKVLAQAAAAGHELPAAILLMRHAEKPEGDKSDPNLTAVGFHRAALLPTLFNPGASGLPLPQVIFAADTSKHSNRPIETITPLARALNLPIDHEFSDHDDDALAKKLLSGAYGGKVILVAWRHGELPHLAKALGIVDAPNWRDDTYDLIWKIEWVAGVPKMTVVHEQLLPGDSH